MVFIALKNKNCIQHLRTCGYAVKVIHGYCKHRDMSASALISYRSAVLHCVVISFNFQQDCCVYFSVDGNNRIEESKKYYYYMQPIQHVEWCKGWKMFHSLLLVAYSKYIIILIISCFFFEEKLSLLLSYFISSTV